MEEEEKGDDGGGEKNDGGGGEKRGNNKRGGIDGSVLKEKEGGNYDDAGSWDDHDFDVAGKGGAERGNDVRDEGNCNDENEDIEE